MCVALECMYVFGSRVYVCVWLYSVCMYVALECMYVSVALECMYVYCREVVRRCLE